MKIRTQLVLASFLLSVLPLSGIVIYSYISSRRALESAYQHEATRVAQQMDRRLSGIRHDLEQRMAALSAMQTVNRGPDVRDVLLTMGDAGSLVDSVEINPVGPVETPPPAPPVAVAAAPGPKASPKSAPRVSPRPVQTAEAIAPEPPDADPDLEGAMLIDLPPAPAVPRFTMTEEQRNTIRTISKLGAKLGNGWASMSAQERKTTEEELKKAQSDLDSSLKATRERWEKEFAAAQDAREQQRLQVEERKRAAREARRAEREAGMPPAAREAIAESAAAAAAASEIASAHAPVVLKRKVTASERESLKERGKQISLLFGHGFDAPVRKQGAVVAQVSAQVSTEEVIDRVLGAASDDRSEIAFAIDREGNAYTRSSAERQKLNDLGIPQRIKSGESLRGIPNWIVVVSRDAQSGLRVGVARPVGENFDELRKTAAKNFGYGIALVFVALIGIVPLANHMTRDVNLVTRGAERVARGDLMTRLPVKSNNEFGQLAQAFNRMAEDISLHQQTIVQQEVQQRLLAADYQRKSVDLEEARRFQLSLLPKELPQSAKIDIGVFTRTATEVGGDYYDFHVTPAGTLSVAVGDATGHGAKAGTMVTVIKTLFSGYGGEVSPAKFLRDAAEKVKRMELGRMAMALLVARFENERLIVASAGMPPVYVRRASTGEIEEFARGATPLGTLGADYADINVDLSPGDTVFLLTDGFPELQNATGQQLGYTRAAEELCKAACGATAAEVIDRLSATASEWHGEQAPNDDVTFVVLRVKGVTA